MGMTTYNSHPWIMFSFNWLIIIWRGGELGQGGGRILDVAGQGGRGVLKIGQFSWMSHGSHPIALSLARFFVKAPVKTECDKLGFD